MVAADAAGRAGLSCYEVEDFRIAVDELCHLLITTTDHEIVLLLCSDETQVAARGSARARDGARPPEPSPLTSAILSSVADSYELHAQDQTVRFLVVKRTQHQAPRLS